MFDVVVIGGGYWGSAIVRRLRAKRLDVLVLDAQREGAASRAAAGLVRASAWEKVQLPWWKQEHRLACRDSFQDDWLEERISSEYAPQPRIRGLIWCGRPLLEEAHLAQVLRLRRENSYWQVVTDVGDYATSSVVLAAGSWCDQILLASGLTTTGVIPAPGHALLGKGDLAGVWTRAYRLSGDTRTRTCTARPWVNGCIRVGDTLPQRENEQLDVMAKFLSEFQTPKCGQIWGIRPKLPSLFVEELAPGLVVATGGYRNGLATSPGVALRVEQLLERTNRNGHI